MTHAVFLNSSIGKVAKDILDEDSETNEESRTNIFTIVAADTLMSTIRPAIEHVLW